MKNTDNPFQEERADVMGFFNRLISLWPVYLLSTIVLVSAAFIAIRYMRPKFKIGTTIILRDENNSSLGAENIIEGLELFAGKNNLENEIGVLKSYSLTRQAVLNSDLEVSYFSKSFFKVTERFAEFPFHVEINRDKLQATEVRFFVKTTSDSTFSVEFDSDKFDYFDFKAEKTIKNTSNQPIQGKVDGVYGKPLETNGLSVTLVKKEYNQSFIKQDEVVFFTINNLEDIIEGYRKEIIIQPINAEASILSLQLERPCIDKEILFLNNLCKTFIERGLSEKNEVAVGTIKFIEEQLNLVNDSLNHSENELQSFRENNEVTDLSLEFQRTKESENVLINELAKEELRGNYISFIKRNISNDNVDWSNLENLGIDDQTLNVMLLELRKLQQEVTVLRGSVSSMHPGLQTAVQQVSQLKGSILSHVNGLEKSASMNKSALQNRIGEVTSSYGNLPQKQRMLIDFERKFNLNNVMFTYLMQKRSEAQIAKSSNTADTKVLDNARLLDKTPTFPKPLLFYLVAVFLGLFIPVFIIIVVDLIDTRIKDKKDLQNLSVPLLGLIGHNFTNSQMPTIDSPRSSIAESLRLLKINMQYLFPGKSKMIIGLTSTVSGEGKTFVSINLAVSLAVAGSRTLLLATDMRKPRIHKVLNIPNNVGLSNYLVSDISLDSVIQQTLIQNLDVMLSGPIPPNPFELLSLDKMGTMLEELKETYDHIIIDSAPIGLVADYFAINDKVDATIFILRHAYSQRKFVSEVLQMQHANRLKNPYFLMNDYKELNSKYGYYGAYKAKYGYSYSYSNNYYSDGEGEAKKTGFFKSLLKRFK
jgi:capsular exopolysaccharide synthesis family protein